MSDSHCLLFRTVRKKNRDGFSLMELMIALGLLSVLMLLGWAMMDSLQRSQERSWKLSQRIRVLRLTRSWLSEDLDHLARGGTAGSNPNDPASVPISFEGDITGFTATILPSLDPVLFLQRLGDEPLATNHQSEVTIESLAATPEELATEQWKQSIWSGDRIDVEYRLEPIYQEDAMLAEIQDPETIQYEIVRREWIPEAYFDQFRATSAPINGVPSAKPLRKGSASDLAKTNPLEAMAAEETEWIPPLKDLSFNILMETNGSMIGAAVLRGECLGRLPSALIFRRSRSLRSLIHLQRIPSWKVPATRCWSWKTRSLRPKPNRSKGRCNLEDSGND
jgi:prepilin-type N-terminal cleavage/methylation domain-containing protein